MYKDRISRSGIDICTIARELVKWAHLDEHTWQIDLFWASRELRLYIQLDWKTENATYARTYRLY